MLTQMIIIVAGSDATISGMDTMSDCFSLDQLDPVIAKCRELQSLLRGHLISLCEDDITSYITRENLLITLKEYGKNYQRHIPIIHPPTFNLYEAPPLLLLAMFCVGACYAEIVRSPQHIFRIAMCVLLSVEKQPVEDYFSLSSQLEPQAN